MPNQIPDNWFSSQPVSLNYALGRIAAGMEHYCRIDDSRGGSVGRVVHTYAIPPMITQLTVPHILGANFMARKASFREIEFVTLTLSKADKKAFESWVGKQDKPLIEHLAFVLADGYKVSQSYDLTNDCVIVAVTGTDRAAFNVGRCFTSRAATLEEALWMALYKHYVTCNGEDWGEPSSDTMRWG